MEDVAVADYGPLNSAQARCVKMLKSQDITLSATADYVFAFQICEPMFVYEAALLLNGNHADAASVTTAIRQLGTSVTSVTNLGGLTLYQPGRLDAIVKARPLNYQDACDCWRYDGRCPGDPQLVTFLWGTATAAHQIEGGNRQQRLLDTRARPGHPLRGAVRQTRADSFQRYRRGHRRSSPSMGLDRVSLQPRVEPDRTLTADRSPPQDSTHYRRIIDTCRDAGLAPVVTLHHFTNPNWMRSARRLGRPKVGRAGSRASPKRCSRSSWTSISCARSTSPTCCSAWRICSALFPSKFPPRGSATTCLPHIGRRRPAAQRSPPSCRPHPGDARLDSPARRGAPARCPAFCRRRCLARRSHR